MADIEPPDDLIKLQRASDEAHAYVDTLTARYGRPTQEGGWTEEQHADWKAAWDAWSDRAEIAQAAVTEHAKEAGQDRGKLEAAVKKAVRHPVLAES